jgi:hypothetical protein
LQFFSFKKKLKPGTSEEKKSLLPGSAVTRLESDPLLGQGLKILTEFTRLYRPLYLQLSPNFFT